MIMLRGDALAPRDADTQTPRAAAKDFYKNDLAQRPEWSSSLGQLVQFTNSGYKKSADVVLEGWPLTVEMIIREDNNGFLYYDHRPVAGLDRSGVSYERPRPVPKTNRGESNRDPSV
ncbi:MAG: hypothetical protein FD149_2271 [Rhodospirillaceae bacterium]|nr:MAG: hypothetical protein FD149_2271 [Rhodospirillaceae bacterium]